MTPSSPAHAPADVHRLANGLRVVAVPRPGAPAAVYLHHAAGSADERPGEHGAAHLLEHMLFKGTARRGIGESAAAIEALGGDLNAWTSHDELVLHATVVDAAWEPALEVLADMVLRPTLDPEEVTREIDVVLEEIRLYDDDPEEVLADAVQAALWSEHPYARRVIAEADEVSALDADTLRTFLSRELTADRATLLVVGDLTTEALLEAAERHLGAWSRGAEGRRDLPPLPAVEGPRWIRPDGDFAARSLSWSWIGPPVGSRDHAALQIVGTLLDPVAGNELASVLERDGVGFDPWADVAFGRASSHLALGCRTEEGGTGEAMARLRGFLEDLAAGLPARRFRRAQARVLADAAFTEQSVGDLAEALLTHVALGGAPAHRDRWLHTLASITVDEATAAVGRWLDPARAVVGVLDPDLPAHGRVPVPPARPTPRPDADGVVHLDRDGGARVRLLADASPVAAVRIVAPGGALRVPARLAGLGAGWQSAVLRGAGRYAGRALDDALQELAAEVDGWCGPHALVISASCPAADLPDLLELLGEVVLDPHFEDEEWTIARRELLDDVRTRPERGAEMAAQAAAARLWAGHPWRLPPGGSVPTLRRIAPKHLAAFHAEHFTARHTLVTVAGGLDVRAVDQALGWLDDLPTEGGGFPRLGEPTPRWGGPLEVRAGREQGLVTLYGPGTSLQAADPTLELAAALLDGQSGRLFLALRERRGLAYDLWARHVEGLGHGLFRAGLGTAPERLEEAARGLRDELERLAAEAPHPDELDRARRMRDAADVLRFQRAEQRAGHLSHVGLLGLPVDPGDRAARRAAVTPEDVRGAMADLLEGGLLEVRTLPAERE